MVRGPSSGAGQQVVPYQAVVSRPGHRMLMRQQFPGLERSGLSDPGALVLKEPSTGSRHLSAPSGPQPTDGAFLCSAGPSGKKEAPRRALVMKQVAGHVGAESGRHLSIRKPCKGWIQVVVATRPMWVVRRNWSRASAGVLQPR